MVDLKQVNMIIDKAILHQTQWGGNLLGAEATAPLLDPYAPVAQIVWEAVKVITIR